MNDVEDGIREHFIAHAYVAGLVLFWAFVAGLALGVGFGTLFAICTLYEAWMGVPM
jgi:hypothetical protein